MPPQNQQSVNINAMLLTKFDALNNQLERLTGFLEAQFKRETRIAREPSTLRAQQDEQMALYDERAGFTGRKGVKTGKRPRPGQESMLDSSAGRDPQVRSTWRDIPEEDRRLPPNSAQREPTLSQLSKGFGRGRSQGQGRYKAMLGAFNAYQSPSASTPEPNENASLPPGGNNLGGIFNNPTRGGHDDNTNVLTWALLGEHGGPAFIRNMALESYGLQRSIGWAQNAAGLLSDNYDQSKLLKAMPLVNPDSLGAFQKAMQIGQDHPYATYAAYKGLQTVGNAAAQAHSNMVGYQALGQQLGYGPPAAIGQNFLGFRNPLGSFGAAAQVGSAFKVEEQGLQGRVPGMGLGNGLSGAQARDVMQTLASQGFSMQPVGGAGGAALSTLSSIPGIGGPLAGLLGGIFGGQPHGDAANIAQNFFRPLMERFPGLSAQDLGQFTGSLRYGGTSIQQLTDQLNSLGVEARATKETVGQFSSSVADTAKTFESLGSSSQGGVAIGTGFTDVTGKDPQFAGILGQSPLVQGLAMTQYGILPSALGDMNSGAFSNLGLSALQMLQRATAGLATDKYRTVHGHKVLIESGQQAQFDQIAKMTGLPSNVVKSMLLDQRGIAARANAKTMLGDPTTGAGFYQYLSQHKGKLNNQEYKHASQVWHDTVANTYKGTGVSPQEMHRIDQIKGLRDRAKAYTGALANASKNDKTNQIQGTPNAQTVRVQFTGAAAKFFQQAGPSMSKKQSNSGGLSISSVVNSVTGDIASGASSIANDIASIF